MAKRYAKNALRVIAVVGARSTLLYSIGCGRLPTHWETRTVGVTSFLKLSVLLRLERYSEHFLVRSVERWFRLELVVNLFEVKRAVN